MLFAGDVPIASEKFRWYAPGNPEQIPFAGDYAGWEVYDLFESLHNSIRHDGIDGVRILADGKNSQVTVRTMSRIQHPLTRKILTFPAYSEIELFRGRLGLILSTYDTDLLSAFLESSEDPRSR